MKKILIIVVLLAAAFLVSPYFIGSSAEKQLKEMYAQMSAHPSYSLEVSEYNKGWFSSQAKIKLVIDGIPNAEIPEFSLIQKLSHGPILMGNRGFAFGISDSTFSLNLPKEAQTEIDKLNFLNEDTFNVDMRVYFNGAFDMSMMMKAFEFEEKDVKVSVNASELISAATSSTHIESSGYWDGMTVTKNGTQVFSFGKMQLSATQELANGSSVFSPYALGDTEFELTIDNIKGQGDSPEQTFNASDLSLTFFSRMNGDLADGGAVISAKSIEAMQMKFTDAVYDLALNNLNYDIVVKMNELMSTPQAQANPMVAMAEVQGLLPELIKHNPILKINNIGVTTEQGKIETTATVQFDQQVYDPNNPMTMMVALDAKANGSAPEAFFMLLGMSEQVEPMVQQNFLVRENGKLKFNFSFNQGQALLNGNPIPLGL